MNVWLYVLIGVGVAIGIADDEDWWLTFCVYVVVWPLILSVALTKYLHAANLREKSDR